MAGLHDKNANRKPGASGSIDAQAEKLLRDIEGTSPFVLRTSYSPEDLDPSDVASRPLEGQPHEAPGGFEEDAHMEVPAVQIVKDVEQVVADQEAQEHAEEQSRLRRHRLRNTLVLVVIVLVIIAAVIGVSVWRNSIAPDVAPSDTESLITSGAVSTGTQFTPVDAALIPNFEKLFGKKLAKVQASTQGKLALQGKNEKASDEHVKSLAYLRSAWLLNASGSRFADATLGLDEDMRLVYVYVRYDIDMLGVADADFSAMLGDGTVAQSLLTGMGVPESAVPLSAVELPDELLLSMSQTVDAASDDDAQEYTFSGETGSKDAPTVWELTIAYDYSVGKLNNDNSVIRSMGVELR